MQIAILRDKSGFLLLAGILMLSLTGCVGMSLRSDSRPVVELVSHAEAAIKAGDYAEAASLYAVVINKEPTVGRYYLRRAELLEGLGHDADAQHVYAQGLVALPLKDPDQIQLMHRAALLAAAGCDRLEFAEKLVQRMPARGVELYDTTAFLYYQSRQYERALELLGKALGKADNPDQKGLILYHMALAHAGLKDKDNTYGALYHALKHVEHRGVRRNIAAFWKELNDPSVAGIQNWPPQTEQCIEPKRAVSARARMITVDY